MGWFVWIIETALCAVSAYSVAAAVYRDRGVLYRLIAALLVAPSLILLSIYATGIPGLLRPLPLALVAAIVFAVPLIIALRRLGAAELVALARSDLGAPRRLWQEVVRERDVSALLVLAGALVIAGAAFLVVIYRSWTWDPMWYHVPITSYTIQYGSLQWIDTSVPWTQSHPRNVELLALWNCIFPLDATLDDSSQIPFGILGAAVVAAWARRAGATRAFAAGLGGAFLLLPPVFLQLWSTHVDVACGASFGAAVFFLGGELRPRDRWMAMLAMGLYVGTKMTGAFHLVMLAPWIAAQAGLELWRARGQRLRRAADVVLSAGGLAALSAFKYVQNLVVTGNPVYAWKTRVPLLGIELPGKFDPATFYDTMPGKNPLFFGANGTLQRLLDSWYREEPTFWPDVRTGGFGVLFAYLLVPAVLWLVIDLFRRRSWRQVLPILALWFASLMVPAPWWPRFVVGAAIAGLVALGRAQGEISWAPARAMLSVAIVVLAFATFYKGASAQVRQADLFMYPHQFDEALRRSPRQRQTLQVVDWLWPEQWARAREAELQAGDVITYDESVNFLGDLFSPDYRTRVEYVPSANVEQFLARIDQLKPRWVGVQRGTRAEAALRQRGAEFLFVAPRSPMALYRVRH